MAFEPEPKNPGDLIRSDDWNAAMTAIVDLFAKMHQATGHQHTGAVEDAPPIGGAGLADGAVTAAKLAANAVTTAAMADAIVTAAKIAAGVIPNIGIAVSMGMANGQLIPVPTGFARSECIFMAAIKYIALANVPAGSIINCQIDANGLLTLTPDTPYTVYAVGAAFGKKGGW